MQNCHYTRLVRMIVSPAARVRNNSADALFREVVEDAPKADICRLATHDAQSFFAIARVLHVTVI